MVIVAAYCLIPAHPGIVFKSGNEKLVAGSDNEWVGTDKNAAASNDSSLDPSRV